MKNAEVVRLLPGDRGGVDILRTLSQVDRHVLEPEAVYSAYLLLLRKWSQSPRMAYSHDSTAEPPLIAKKSVKFSDFQL